MFYTFSNDFYRAKIHFSNESAKYITVFLPTFCVYLQILLMDLGVTAFTVSLLPTNKNLIPETSIWY